MLLSYLETYALRHFAGDRHTCRTSVNGMRNVLVYLERRSMLVRLPNGGYAITQTGREALKSQ